MDPDQANDKPLLRKPSVFDQGKIELPVASAEQAEHSQSERKKIAFILS